MAEMRPPLDPDDRGWMREFFSARWASETMITRGRAFHVDTLDALLAWENDRRVGLITWRQDGSTAEIMSLDALAEAQGIGSALLASAEDTLGQSGVKIVEIITSNDNLNALRFYQRRGYRLSHVFVNAIDEARRLKPNIPRVGDYGIPIHDEILLIKRFTAH